MGIYKKVYTWREVGSSYSAAGDEKKKAYRRLYRDEMQKNLKTGFCSGPTDKTDAESTNSETKQRKEA